MWKKWEYFSIYFNIFALTAVNWQLLYTNQYTSSVFTFASAPPLAVGHLSKWREFARRKNSRENKRKYSMIVWNAIDTRWTRIHEQKVPLEWFSSPSFIWIIDKSIAKKSALDKSKMPRYGICTRFQLYDVMNEKRRCFFSTQHKAIGSKNVEDLNHWDRCKSLK